MGYGNGGRGRGRGAPTPPLVHYTFEEFTGDVAAGCAKYTLCNGTIFSIEPMEDEGDGPPPMASWPLRTYSWMVVEDGVVAGVGMGGAPPVRKGQKGKGAGGGRPEVHVDLGGRIVLPGLWDAHCHVYAQACLASVVGLAECHSVDSIVEQLQAKAAVADPAATPRLEGVQWDQVALGRLPDRRDLDRVGFAGPIICHRRCWHIACVNTAGLAACGLMDPGADLPEGVDVDGAGVPTGIVRENACTLVNDCLGATEPPLAVKAAWTARALREYAARGVTSIQTNDGKAIGGIDDPWALYKHLIAPEGVVGPAVYPRIFMTCESSPAALARDYRGSVRPEVWARLSCERCKVFMDGGLGASTAALTAPYADTDPDFDAAAAGGASNTNKGMLTMSDADVERVWSAAYEKGMRIEAHAIGDAAFEKIVDALERHKWQPRLAVTHCQILNPALKERLKAYAGGRVIASVQPQFAVSDAPIVVPKLGEARARDSYVWRALMRECGMVVAGGSDAPVEAVAPLRALALCLRHPLHASESMTPEEALAMFTVNAAYAACRDGDLGMLTPGFRADYIVLDTATDAATFWNDTIFEDAFQLTGVARACIDGASVYEKAVDGALAEGPTSSDTMMPGRSGCPCCRRS